MTKSTKIIFHVIDNGDHIFLHLLTGQLNAGNQLEYGSNGNSKPLNFIEEIVEVISGAGGTGYTQVSSRV
jgi:hypothetical protein